MGRSGLYFLVGRVALSAFVFCVVACAAGCGGDGDATACLEPLPRAEDDGCNLAHAPRFDVIYEQTLDTGSCGDGNACHTPSGAASGLVLRGDADRAYDNLLGGGAPLVIPGDPECSELVRRLESDDPNFQMPLGDELAESKRCAIIQWIANGAER